MLAIFIFITIFSCSAGPFVLITQYDNEIDPTIRNQLHDIGNKINNGIENEDFSPLRRYFSQELLESDQFNLEEFTKQVSAYFNNNQISLMYEYYSLLKKSGSVNNATILPDERNRFIINQAYFDTNESYALFYKIDGGSSQLLSYIYLNKYDDGWKVTNMHLGSYSIGNLNAPDLYLKMEESLESGKIGSALFYGVAMLKVLRPVNNLQYKNESEYKGTIENIISDFQKENQFPIEINQHMSIYYMDVNSVDGASILPTIKYVTDIKMNESYLKELIESNLDDIYRMLPGLKEEFTSILFQAFSEPPIDPNKTYNLFGTIIDTGR